MSPTVQTTSRQIPPIVRWTIFAASLAVIAYILIEWIPSFTSPSGHWSDRLIRPLFLFGFSWPLLLTAYASHREQYLRVWKVFSFFVAIATAMFLMAAQNRVDVDKLIMIPTREYPGLALITVPLTLLLFFFPAWAGVWLYFRSVQAGRRFLQVGESIAMGERAVEEGRVVSHEDARERMERWLR